MFYVYCHFTHFRSEFNALKPFIEISYQELEKIGKELPTLILNTLSENERNFLLSVTMGNPDFGLLSISDLENFPAIDWKVENILKMEIKKRTVAVEKLKSILNSSNKRILRVNHRS